MLLSCGIKKRVQKFVIENGGKISSTDPALFMWHENEDLIGVMCTCR